MKPYLVIIADSFREALASRVLWILLILITVVLVAIIPLGFRAEQMTEFRQGDFLDARALVKAIHGDFDRGAPSPGQRMWSTFDEQTRRTLNDFQRDDEDNRRKYFADLPKLIQALNDLLKNRGLHDEQAWGGVLLGSEARELLERGINTLPEDDLARLNRLLIETPYEEYFRPQPPKQIFITYFGFRISPPIRASEKLVKQIIEQMVLPAVIGVLVGFIGVLAAILVTAPIIPQMFDPGSLSLLLSKPVSRSLMFLAKFVGGCAFILINVTYLIVGLWGIVGLRLGIWSHGLLLCIPIFLFLFAVYYSVSAFSGVIWRNAVVCVVMTVLFWFACTVVGTTKAVFEQIAVETKRLIRLVPAADTLIALDERGATYRWDAETTEWQAVFLEGGGGPTDRVLGPVYDAQQHVLLASRAGNRGMFGSSRALLVGKESDGWTQADGPALPDGTWELLPDPRGRLLAVTNTGVQQLVGDLEAHPKKLQVFFMEIPQSFGKPFRSAGPTPPLKLTSPATAAVDPQSGNVMTYSRGELTWLVRQDNDYHSARTVSVDADKDQDAIVIHAGSTVLLALADGRILNYEAPALTLRGTYQPEPESQPRFACASPDGKMCAIVFHNGRLHVLDTAQKPPAPMQLADVRGQGDISAVTFSADNALLVVDRVKRVTRYQGGAWDRVETYAPALTPLEIAYHYAVVPIYTVFPQPGELDNTIQYLLRKEETIDMGMPGGDLQTKRLRLRPWAPVRSSLIFMLVVLGLACLYIERQDF
jgi:ABC-type transport system involved in multi-copper enzyme maturation permease subunit